MAAALLAGSATVATAQRSGPDRAPEAGAATQRVLAGFRRGVPDRRRRAIVRSVGGRVLRVIGAGTTVLAVRKGRVGAVVRRLRARRGVAYAEPDYLLTASATPRDPFYRVQWGLANHGQRVKGQAGKRGADVNAEAAWGRTAGSPGIVAAVLDTGVDYTHPDLAPNMWSNPGVAGCPAGTPGFNVRNGAAPCDPMDDDSATPSHGTRVAGLLAAAGDNGKGIAGMSRHTTIMAVKWLDQGATGSNSHLIAAIDKVIAARQAGVGVRVINVSQTFVGTPASAALRADISRAGDNGILFVTAAGNTSQDNDDPATPRYPCNYGVPNEVCVTASDQKDRLATFANYGAATVDLAAPGVNSYSTLRGGGYDYGSGGSYAAPLVSGSAALALSLKDMSASDLRQRLLQAVDVVPGLGGRVRTSGRLDVCKALPGCVPQNVRKPRAGRRGRRAATVTASIDPRGQASRYRVAYGRTRRLGSRTRNRSIGGAVTYETIRVRLRRLHPGTRYHFRVIVSSAAGRRSTPDRSFRTRGRR